MKDSGIGTPATRAAIIERLIDVGYLERDGRALVATEKGLNVIRLLGEHPLTSPALTGDWEHRLAQIEHGADSREPVHGRHREVRRRDGRRPRRQAQGRAHPARQPRALPGLRPRDRREPQGLLVLVARGPGLRLRHLEGQGGQEAPGRRGQGADQDRPHRQAGDRVQGPVRPLVPRPARPPADRGGQVAGGVRRAVGAARAPSRPSRRRPRPRRVPPRPTPRPKRPEPAPPPPSSSPRSATRNTGWAWPSFPPPATCCAPRTSPTPATSSRSTSTTWPAPPASRAPTSAASSARAFGESPHAYLLTRRLERAAALLRTTDRSVADICFSVGLQSVGSFTTSFTRTYGCRRPPTARPSRRPPTCALVPACVVRAYGRPQRRTFREDSGAARPSIAGDRPIDQGGPR